MMIENILEEIKQAEEKATKIINDAEEHAKQIVIDADKTAVKIKLEATAFVKEQKQMVVELAEQDAKKIFDKTISEGYKSAERIIANTDIKPAVEFIKDELFNLYVGR
ncbi:MAG: hypothetical protein K5765_01590 [Clostridia bacterium]|nr:hypothetical protein [Clostridia bacterium]